MKRTMVRWLEQYGDTGRIELHAVDDHIELSITRRGTESDGSSSARWTIGALIDPEDDRTATERIQSLVDDMEDIMSDQLLEPTVSPQPDECRECPWDGQPDDCHDMKRFGGCEREATG